MKSALQLRTVEFRVISVSLGFVSLRVSPKGAKEEIKSCKLIQTLWTGPEMETDCQ